jgi:DNA-binding NarL/FixJ family response regulator
VGTKSNANDVGSPYAQVAKGIRVRRLDHRDKETGEWREILLEDRHAGPAETAAARIDFGEWLKSLSRRYRRIATTLATGETTKRVARRFRVSPGRVSQIRRELLDAWNRFQGEAEAPAAVA